MTTTTKSLPLADLGPFELTTPKITLDSGVSGPRIMFIAGQHGNETTPLFVLRDLFARLQKNPIQKGSIVIIPSANPLGLLFGTRQEPLDGKNLNRSFPGSNNKDLPKRIASVLLNECTGADLVVDLHTFSRQTKFVGILIKSEDTAEKEARAALRAIAPDLIWQINMTRSDDKRYAGSLDIVCAERGIPAITLEMERLVSISQETVARVTDRLAALLAELGMIEKNRERAAAEIPIFEASYLYFESAGLFEPSVAPGDSIAKGDALGTLTDMRSFTDTVVCAPMNGTVLTIRFRDVVRMGTKLGSIGTRIGTL